MRFSSYICILASLVLLFGCKSRLDAPHLVDPIYKDLQQRLSRAENELGEIRARTGRYKRDMDRALPQTGQFARARSQHFKAARATATGEQKVKLLKLQMKSREIEVKEEYQQAFAQDRPWPSPELAARYAVHKKLRDAAKEE